MAETNPERLMVAMAEAVLKAAKGRGFWQSTSDDSPRYQKPKEGEYLPGLCVGDLIWWVDEDNHCEVCSAAVLLVQDGAGYFAYSGRDFLSDKHRLAPKLELAGNGYYKTKREALAAGRDNIEFELQESLAAAERVERLKALLAEIEG